jgi:hypothetical protein
MVLPDTAVKSSHAGQRVATFMHLISMSGLKEASVRTREANHRGIILLTFTA